MYYYEQALSMLEKCLDLHQKSFECTPDDHILIYISTFIGPLSKDKMLNNINKDALIARIFKSDNN